MSDKFVFAKRDIELKDIQIEKNEVGIILSKVNHLSVIHFIYKNKKVEVNNIDIENFDTNETGDGCNKKVCNVCHKLLDTDMFAKNQNGKNNRTVRRPSCNDCRIIINGVDLLTEEKKRMNKIKPHLEIFECQICKKRTIAGLTSKVVIDHNHTTGKARGFICDSCNTGLGRFKDNIDLLECAIEYLKSFSNNKN